MTRSHGELPSVKDFVRQNGRSSPDALAFEDDDESVTWGEFDERSRRAAGALLDYAAQGDRIAFLCKSSVRHAVLLAGAMRAGCIATNLHVRASTEVLQYCVEQTRPKVLVIDEAYADRVDADLRGEVTGSVATVVVVGEPSRAYHRSASSFVDAAPAVEPDVRTESEDVAYISWTSGSTGRPKGWCLTHRALYVKGMYNVARFGVDRSGKILLAASPSFAAWLNEVLKALVGCESVYFFREWHPKRWLEAVEERRVTHSGMVASMWREVLEHGAEEYDCSSLSSAWSTGEKLDRLTLERIREHVCDSIIQTYGSTEFIVATMYADEMEGDRVGSVGKPQTGTEVRIVEEGGSVDDELGPNEVGEIIVRAPDAPTWVWRDSERTREAFDEGWWRSGDLGYRDEGGYLFIEGRVDFMIKSRGVKVMPAPIEEALNAHPDVELSAVVGVEDEEYGQRVTAIVQPARDDLTAAALEEWMQESEAVADFERPREYRFVEDLERTASGKLDRKATKAKLDFE